MSGPSGSIRVGECLGGDQGEDPGGKSKGRNPGDGNPGGGKPEGEPRGVIPGGDPKGDPRRGPCGGTPGRQHIATGLAGNISGGSHHFDLIPILEVIFFAFPPTSSANPTRDAAYAKFRPRLWFDGRNAKLTIDRITHVEHWRENEWLRWRYRGGVQGGWSVWTDGKCRVVGSGRAGPPGS